MMVNFTCQLGWAAEPGYVVARYSDVALRLLLDKINILISGLSNRLPSIMLIDGTTHLKP